MISQFASEPDIEHHAWQCISFMRRYSTLDLRVKNENDMMALIHVLGRHVYKQTDSAFMGVYHKLRFKMKLGYECWKKNCELSKLVLGAIKKTIDETKALAIATV